MQSKILFLGTAGDAVVMGKQQRASGGIVFQYEDNQFQIDPGPGAVLMAKMTGINLRENTSILISSNTMLAASDGNAAISAMTLDGMDKRGVLVGPSSLGKEGSFILPQYAAMLERVITIDNTRKIGINNIDIEIIELKGDISTQCGFKFITPRFNLAYLPATGFSENMAESLKETDILIVSVRNPRGIESEDCLDSAAADRIIKMANPQIAVITGFGVKMLQADPLYEIREMQKNAGIQVIAAKDGMTVNPSSFASTVRQKNLRSF
jgi:hypothetical protein